MPVAILKTAPFVENVIRKMNSRVAVGYDIHLCRVFGHVVGIPVNEHADQTAKDALNCGVAQGPYHVAA